MARTTRRAAAAATASATGVVDTTPATATRTQRSSGSRSSATAPQSKPAHRSTRRAPLNEVADEVSETVEEDENDVDEAEGGNDDEKGGDVGEVDGENEDDGSDADASQPSRRSARARHAPVRFDDEPEQPQVATRARRGQAKSKAQPKSPAKDSKSRARKAAVNKEEDDDDEEEEEEEEEEDEDEAEHEVGEPDAASESDVGGGKKRRTGRGATKVKAEKSSPSKSNSKVNADADVDAEDADLDALAEADVINDEAEDGAKPKKRKRAATAKSKAAAAKPARSSRKKHTLKPPHDASVIRAIESAVSCLAANTSLIDASCCSRCSGRECFRGVYQHNLTLLNAVLNDTENVSDPLLQWAPDSKEDPLMVAIQTQDLPAFKLLWNHLMVKLALKSKYKRAGPSEQQNGEITEIEDQQPVSTVTATTSNAAAGAQDKGKKGKAAKKSAAKPSSKDEVVDANNNSAAPSPRTTMPVSSLTKLDTGKSNFYQFGHATRKINASRGGKEGNNAFTADIQDSKDDDGDDAGEYGRFNRHAYYGSSFHDNDSSAAFKKYFKFAVQRGDIAVVDFLMNSRSYDDPHYFTRHPPADAIFQTNRDRCLGLIKSSMIASAAEAGNLNVCHHLLGLVHKDPACGFNPLHHLVTSSSVHTLPVFRAPSATKKASENLSITPMHLAAINPNLHYIQELTKVGGAAALHTTDMIGRTPVHYAACNANGNVLKWLVSRGADVNVRDKQGKSPIEFAVKYGRAHNIQYLVPKPPPSVDDKPATTATKKGLKAKQKTKRGDDSGEDVEMLEDTNVDVAALAAEASRAGGRSKKGKAEAEAAAYSVLLNDPVALLNATDKKTGQTILHRAAEYGYGATCAELIKNGADPIKQDKEKQSVLMLAACSGDAEMMDAIINAALERHRRYPIKAEESEEDYKSRLLLLSDRCKRTVAHWAVKNGKFAIIRSLLLLGVDVNSVDSSENSLLHYAAAYGWHDIVTLLLQANANPSPLNMWKLSPLFIAMLKNHLRVAELLLSAPGVEVNSVDSEGRTVLFHALLNKSQSIDLAIKQVHFLAIERRANVSISDARGQRPLHALANAEPNYQRWKDVQLARLLLDAGAVPDINHADDEGETALSLAVKHNHWPLVQLLLAQGAKIDTRNKDGVTPLIHALKVQPPAQPLAQAYQSKKYSEQREYVDKYLRVRAKFIEHRRSIIDSLLSSHSHSSLQSISDDSGDGYDWLNGLTTSGESPIHLAVTSCQTYEDLQALIGFRGSLKLAVDAKNNQRGFGCTALAALLAQTPSLAKIARPLDSVKDEDQADNSSSFSASWHWQQHRNNYSSQSPSAPPNPAEQAAEKKMYQRYLAAVKLLLDNGASTSLPWQSVPVKKPKANGNTSTSTSSDNNGEALYGHLAEDEFVEQKSLLELALSSAKQLQLPLFALLLEYRAPITTRALPSQDSILHTLFRQARNLDVQQYLKLLESHSSTTDMVALLQSANMAGESPIHSLIKAVMPVSSITLADDSASASEGSKQKSTYSVSGACPHCQASIGGVERKHKVQGQCPGCRRWIALKNGLFTDPYSNSNNDDDDGSEEEEEEETEEQDDDDNNEPFVLAQHLLAAEKQAQSTTYAPIVDGIATVETETINRYYKLYDSKAHTINRPVVLQLLEACAKVLPEVFDLQIQPRAEEKQWLELLVKSAAIVDTHAIRTGASASQSLLQSSAVTFANNAGPQQGGFNFALLNPGAIPPSLGLPMTNNGVGLGINQVSGQLMTIQSADGNAATVNSSAISSTGMMMLPTLLLPSTQPLQGLLAPRKMLAFKPLTGKALQKSATASHATTDTRPPCRYGMRCYRTLNPVHTAEYSHPQLDDRKSSGLQSTKKSRKHRSAFPLTPQQQLKELAKQYQEARQPELGFTPLLLAVQANDSEAVRWLIEHGASVTQTDSKGRTPLILACQLRSSVAIPELLLKRDVDQQINAADQLGFTPLICAVDYSARHHSDHQRGFEEAFIVESLLLESGADVNQKDKYERTALHYVFVPRFQRYAQNSFDAIELLTDLAAASSPHQSSGTAMMMDWKDIYGATPLLYNAQCGGSISAKYLLSRGSADITVVDNQGNGAFQHALLNKHLHHCVDLVDKGVDFLRPIYNYLAPPSVPHPERLVSCFKFVLKQQWMGLAFLMMDRGISVESAVTDALSNDLFQLARTLIAKSHRSQLGNVNSQGQNLFHILASYNSASELSRHAYDGQWCKKMIDLLVSLGVDAPVFVRAIDSKRRLPLHYAAMNGHRWLCQWLLDQDKSLINSLDFQQRTPLTLAVYGDRQETLHTLCRNGADLNGHYSSYNAIRAQHQSLINQYKVNSPKKSAPLTRTKSIVLQQAPVHYDAPPVDEDTLPPLHHAVRELKYVTVLLMLRQGADPNVVDGKGQSGLVYAVKINDARLVHCLLNHTDDKENLPSSTARLAQFPDSASVKHRGLDLTTADSEGRTIIHNAVIPFGQYEAAYENVELLQTIGQGGQNRAVTNIKPKFDSKDKYGKTAMYYASQQASGSMFIALTKLGAKLSDKDRQAAVKERDQHLAHNSENQSASSLNAIEVDEDVKALQSWFNQQNTAVAESDDAGQPVEVKVADSELAKTTRVFVDAATNTVYDVDLNYTDTGYGRYGIASFYKMQLLHNSAQDLYILLNKWGRTGDKGETQRTPMNDRASAVKEFEKIFKQKTANTWDNRAPDKFEPKTGKYTITRSKEQKKQKNNTGANSGSDTETVDESSQVILPLRYLLEQYAAVLSPSSLPTALQTFIRTICDLSSLKHLSQRLGIQSDESNPLATISEEQLRQGRQVLNEIHAVIEKYDIASSELSLLQQQKNQAMMAAFQAQANADNSEDNDGDATMTSTSSSSSAAQSKEIELDEKITAATASKTQLDYELTRLSNLFYMHVPRSDVAKSAIQAIKTKKAVSKEIFRLTQILDFFLAEKVLMGARWQLQQRLMNPTQVIVHPLNYCYLALGMTMRPLASDDRMYQHIRTYMYSSANAKQYELYDVFECYRADESLAYESFSAAIDNKRLLWHGSSRANFVGLLTRGLKIAPPEAETTGYAFGKGIYLADQFAKSIDYCRLSDSNYDQHVGQAWNRYNSNHYHHNSSISNDSADDDEERYIQQSQCLLLAEAALGRAKHYYQSEYMEKAADGYQSTLAVGRRTPDPKTALVTVNGVSIPLGPIIEATVQHGQSPCVNSNEFIVYNEAQCCIRYVVRVGPVRKKKEETSKAQDYDSSSEESGDDEDGKEDENAMEVDGAEENAGADENGADAEDKNADKVEANDEEEDEDEDEDEEDEDDD